MSKLLSFINTTQLLDWFSGFGDLMASTVGNILWGLCDIFFVVLNLFDDLFRRFAGLRTGRYEMVNGVQEEVKEDIVLYLIQSSVVQEIFMSILVLSLFLLIIFTIFAVVKNQYSDKQEPVSKIINGSIKALFMYLLVPVATVVCLMVGNVVLQAIDGATGDASRNKDNASAMLFSCATYNANKLRNDDTNKAITDLRAMIDEGYLNNIETEFCRVVGGTTFKDINWEQVAGKLPELAVVIDESFLEGKLNSGWGNAKADIYEFGGVARYYNVLSISYLIIWVGGAFLIWAIGKITWGLVMRMFKMVLFYAISPAVMATFPIDNGKALGAWRGEMVKNGTMAFCAVGVMNVLYSILPFIDKLNLGGVYDSGIAMGIIKLFIYIIAFSSAKDLIATVSGWFGTGDALAEGVKARGMVSSQVKNAVKKVSGAYMGFEGGKEGASVLHSGNSFKDRMARFGGGLTGAYKGSGLAEKFGDPIAFKEELKKQKSTGRDFYEGKATFFADIGSDSRNPLIAKLSKNAEDAKEKFEQKKSIDEAKKSINKLCKELEAHKQALIQSIQNDSSKSATVKAMEIAEATDKYDKKIRKAKAGAEYLKTELDINGYTFADNRERIDKEKEMLDKIRSFQQFAEARARLESNITRNVGATATEKGVLHANWDNIVNGDYSAIPARIRTQVEGQLDKFKEQIANNQTQMGDAMFEINDLYANGGKKFLEDLLGAASFVGGELQMTSSQVATYAQEIKTKKADLKTQLDDLEVRAATKYDS